jgi:(p)ppGpp synthase/HD superfamily hydrolase
MITLERAIALAADAHAGTTDKGGTAPYILHPLRVMLAQSSMDARIVGVFHDVLEDCRGRGWTLERLPLEGFTGAHVRALEALTKRPGEEGTVEGYMRFVARAAADPIARKVKLADLRDNLDATRLPHIDAVSEARMRKYRAAVSYLEAVG